MHCYEDSQPLSGCRKSNDVSAESSLTARKTVGMWGCNKTTPVGYPRKGGVSTCEAAREPCKTRTHHNHTRVLGRLPRLLPGLGLLIVQHAAGERACEKVVTRYVRVEYKRREEAEM